MMWRTRSGRTGRERAGAWWHARRPRIARVLAVVFSVIALAALGLASLAVARTNAAEQRVLLQERAETAAAAVHQRFDRARTSLVAARGVFLTDDDPSPERYRAHLRTALPVTVENGSTRYNGLGTVAFVRHVRAGDTSAFLARRAQQGRADAYADIDATADSYVVDLVSNPDSAVLGVDLRPIDTRRVPLERARDTARPSVTEWVVSVTERGSDPGAVDQIAGVYVPVYRDGRIPESVPERRRNLLGWTVTVISASELLEWDGTEGRAIDVALYDGTPAPETFVRATSPDAVPTQGSAHLVRPIDVGDRTWSLVVAPTDQPLAPVAVTRHPAFVAVGGLLLGLCGVAIAALTRRRRRVERQVRDVTAELRESEQSLRLLADSVPVGLFDVDVDTGRSFVNRTFRDMTGGDWAHWTDVAADAPAIALREEAIEALEPGVELVDRFPLGSGDGGRWLEVHAVRVDRDGASVRVLGSLTDVTADVHAEERLAEARDQALANSRMKSEFLANMSHEIRTPLNGVIGMATLLLDGALTDRQRDRVITLRSAGEHLLELLNDILVFSRIEAGRLTLDAAPFSVRTSLNEVLALYASPAADRGLRLWQQVDDEIPDLLVGDPVRLRQVLQNLVGNALKFTAHGEIGVTVEAVDRDAGRHAVRFAVCDTGVGIPDEAQQLIFEAFRQGDASLTRVHGGSGLGLAICSQLVRLMGGRLEVESTVGAGSTFVFTLWLSAVTPTVVDADAGTGSGVGTADGGTGSGMRTVGGGAGNGVPTATGVRPLHVLLVEDNAINRDVALGLLAKLGHSADTAEDGGEALRALRRSSYDAVLMDCQMPGLDGYETTAHLRAMEGDERHTPVIAMTAAAMYGDRERCLAAGMDDYVAKPVTPAALDDALRRVGGTPTGDADRSAGAPTGGSGRPSPPAADAADPSAARGA